MTKVYFITHPDVTIDPEIPVPKWPLSPRGLARMEKLLERPWLADIVSLHCSTEVKAVDAAEILAHHLGVTYRADDALSEIDRSATGYLPQDAYWATSALFFAHPDRNVQGWESAREAQRRIVETVAAIVEAHEGSGDIAIVSHGGVGALYLCHLKGCAIDQGEDQPGSTGGNYYCFDAASGRLLHGWRPID